MRHSGAAMPSEPTTTSIVVPMLNEAATLPSLLKHLKQIGQQPGIEVLLVDGGSEDNSVVLARAAGFEVLQSKPGRAVQMNTGAAMARGQLLVFLHADTRLPLIDLTGLGQHLQARSEEHTSELQSRGHLVCRLLLEKKKT